MHSSSTIAALALAAFFLPVLWCDFRWRRIPNRLIAVGVVGAVVLQSALAPGDGLFDGSHPGALGPGRCLMAAAAGLLPGLLLWRVRFFGAGDAKLLAAVSAFLGLEGVVPLYAATMMAGGLVVPLIWATRWAAFRFCGAVPFSDRMPYSVAIALGTAAAVVVQQSGLRAPWIG